jgi:hypothetical protein
MCYFYRFSRFFYETSIFQRLQKGHTEEFKGPQVAHGCPSHCISALVKKISGGLVCMGGAAGVLAMQLFSTTLF